MKRILVLLFSLILVFSLCVFSAFASDSYILTTDDSFDYMGLPLLPVYIHEGKYTAVLTESGLEPYVIGTIDISYAPTVYAGLDCWFSSTEVVPFDIGDSLLHSVDIGYAMIDGNYGTLVRFGIVGQNAATALPSYCSLELIPVSSNHLSTVVDSDMLDGVFHEILSILPVIVLVIVGFIAIRKGIVFLTDVLRQA